jgi:sugar diacid utilization regulator
MQVDELQELVDRLASQLGRSVAIDDQKLQVLAASQHFGDEDPMRIRAIMRRTSEPLVAEYLLGQGIEHWSKPDRIPANPELEIKQRVCVPIRVRGLLMGFLFLIDESLQDWEIDRAFAATDEAGLILYRRLVLHERERGREEALLRDLVAADPTARARARQEIDEDRLLVPRAHAVVAAVEIVDPPVDREDAEIALRTATEHARRAEPTGTVLSLVQGRRATLLRVADHSPDTAAWDLAQRMVSELRTELDSARCVAGVGTAQSGLDAAVISYEQARAAARAAALLPALGDITTWEGLGVFAFLIKIAPHELSPTLFPPAVRTLVERGNSDGLLHTAEVYLDCAGDARRAANALHIHRSSLYYRLERIADITGMDLRDGSTRLVLHLGLKLARLIGASPQPPDPTS